MHLTKTLFFLAGTLAATTTANPGAVAGPAAVAAATLPYVKIMGHLLTGSSNFEAPAAHIHFKRATYQLVPIQSVA